MYKVVRHHSENKITIEKNNELVACILQNHGGILQKLILDGKDIIDGSNINGSNQFFKNSILFPFTGRITDGKYTFENKSYQLEKNEPYSNNALHGLVFNQIFDLVSVKEEEEKAEISLSYKSNGCSGYPFPYSMNITYIIKEKTINFIVKITNIGEDTMPFGIGWHPYFKIQDSYSTKIQLNSRKKYITNNRLVPIDYTETNNMVDIKIDDNKFDESYLLSSDNILITTGDYQLRMKIINGDNNNYLHIYTPSEKNSVAIEPLTCTANVFNNENGLQLLKSNEEYNWGVQLEILL